MITEAQLHTKPTVLYIDDEAYNLIAFKASFRNYYTVYTAESAREAIEILKKNNIEVIITDQRMPEITGVAFLKSIVNDYPGTVRMILTGYTDVEAIIQAINDCKVFHYITKPWDEADLKQIIDNGIQVAHLEKHVTDLVTQLQEELLKKESVIKTFQKYVPSEIVTRMLNPEHDKQLFEGETIIISILFADIRNFVKIASQLTPKQTVAYLNKYFTIMSECIKNRSGTVDKFIGDGILALFGAPISYPENQKNSVLCALDMLEALKKFNDECRVELGFDTAIGIGINTGPAIVGNIGSDQYLEYTAIGDTVNMAARTEQLTKDMPNTILITQSTYDLVKEFVHAEKLESQFIKGKSEKIDVYKVTGKKTR